MITELQTTTSYIYVTITVEHSEIIRDEDRWVEETPGDPETKMIEMEDNWIIGQMSDEEILKRVKELWLKESKKS